MGTEGYCHECGQELASKEDDASILLMCTNDRCNNYWTNKGCEIVMMLK